MKKIFKFFGALLTVALTVALTGCTVKEDLETAEVGLHIKVFFPTKVVAGQPMTINGSGFAEATSVVFPGEVEVTDIEIVSNDMIRVNAPAGIAAEGGTIIVRTPEGDAVSPLPLTLGNTVYTGCSADPAVVVDGGSQITLYGTDLEFVSKIEMLDEDGNVIFIEDELFNRKSTTSIIFTVPKKVFEGTFVAKIYTVDGKVFNMPELTYKPKVEGGYWETVKNVIWENPDPAAVGAVAWSGQYRFGLEGTDGNNECITTFPAETWDIIKNGTFYILYTAPEAYQIRVNTGWWSFDSAGTYDIHPGNELITDNGDGTFSLQVTISEEPLKSGIYDLIDQQHLLLTGNGYTPLQIYTNEEVWVEGGGSIEIVRTSIWKNDGSVGAANWDGTYRYAKEGMDGNNECVAEIPAETWEKMKTTPFNVQITPAADWWQVRILDGHWSIGNSESNDISPNTPDKFVDNGDGTFTFVVDLQAYPEDGDKLVTTVDEKHLLFSGSGFIINEIFWEEEVFVPGGGDTPKEVVVWENDGSFPSCNWGGHYRFGLEGNDGLNECAATFPQDVWDRLKSAPFNILIQPVGDWFSIRVMDGWWSVGNDQSGARDLTPQTEGVVNNGDGTFVVPISLPDDLLPVLDAQHLLFSGGEYTLLKIYYVE